MGGGEGDNRVQVFSLKSHVRHTMGVLGVIKEFFAGAEFCRNIMILWKSECSEIMEERPLPACQASSNYRPRCVGVIDAFHVIVENDSERKTSIRREDLFHRNSSGLNRGFSISAA